MCLCVAAAVASVWLSISCGCVSGCLWHGCTSVIGPSLLVLLVVFLLWSMLRGLNRAPLPPPSLLRSLYACLYVHLLQQQGDANKLLQLLLAFKKRQVLLLSSQRTLQHSLLADMPAVRYSPPV